MSDDIAIPVADFIAFLPTAVQGQHHVLRLCAGSTASDLPTLETYLVSDLPSSVLSDNVQRNLYANSGIDQSSSPRKRFISVIVSINSGARLAAAFHDKILSQLPFVCDPAINTRVEIYRTTSSTSITEFCQKTLIPVANSGEHQDIVLLSGDGGVVDIVDAFYSTPRSPTYARPTLHILPFGTGNALANSYGCNDDNTWGLSSLFRGTRRPLPAIRISFSPGARLLVPETLEQRKLARTVHDGRHVLYAAVVCSWGLHASLVCDSDTTAYRKFGAERFLMAARALVYGSEVAGSNADGNDDGYRATYRGRVSYRSSADGDWITLDRVTHSYILATLVSNLEKTFTVSPDSRRLDGKLRLLDIPPVRGDYFMSIADAAYDGGRHVGMERVGYREIHGLRVDFEDDDPRGRIVCVDGKIVRIERGGRIEVETLEESLLDVAHFAAPSGPAD